MKKIKINLLMVLMTFNLACISSVVAFPANYSAAVVSISVGSIGLTIRANANCRNATNSANCRSAQTPNQVGTSARRYKCGSKPNGKFIWCNNNRRRRIRTRRNLPIIHY